MFESACDLLQQPILYLSLAAFLTSAFAAMLGQGGGLMLMGLLTGFIPAHLLIPIHGIIQACSNGSRAALALPNIHWAIITPVLIGIVIGACLASPFLSLFNWVWMQGIIGVFILWITWGKGLQLSHKIPFALPSLGLLQGSLGMLLGATGPLGNALLLNKDLGKHDIIASNAVIMLASHIMKIILFTAIGMQLHTYFNFIVSLSLAAILGSVFGTRLRHSLPEKYFFPAFKLLLTLLALRMIALAFQ